MQTLQRRLPVGAEIVPDGVHFRVWAPRRSRVRVEIEAPERRSIPLVAEKDGYHSGLVAELRAGARYRFGLDGEGSFPDPASRFQPDGPHESSEVVDPLDYAWGDDAWAGVVEGSPVLYEMHVGTFTPQGTWDAAAKRLPQLKELGISVVEVMPVAEFPGRFGWGYDGVNLFAPYHHYGRPEAFRAFVDQAHQLGLGVILDVVYNHFGPDGCYVAQFSEDYFKKDCASEWGCGLNFDGPGSAAVREFFIANAESWIREFHLDGLRFDATQAMLDASDTPLLAEMAARLRGAAKRPLLLIAENEPQDTQLVRRPEEGGYGLDALWNDDFHHSAKVALTGKREAYYVDYLGSPEEFVALATRGLLYQGQYYSWQNKNRGSSTQGLEPRAFVSFLENHDQVANSAFGRRLWQETAPGAYRAMLAMTLLGPGMPLLFQGQESGSATPFLYFADHRGDLAQSIREGRAKFLAQFPSIDSESLRSQLPDPCDEDSFRRSILGDFGPEAGGPHWRLHRDLLALRRSEAALRTRRFADVAGAVIGDRCIALRFRGKEGDDRLLVVNLGVDVRPTILPEPLLAPPSGFSWSIRWSSEDPGYGGNGVAALSGDGGLRVPGQAALLLRPTGGTTA